MVHRLPGHGHRRSLLERLAGRESPPSLPDAAAIATADGEASDPVANDEPTAPSPTSASNPLVDPPRISHKGDAAPRCRTVTMECIECGIADVAAVEVTFSDGTTGTFYLCERCIGEYRKAPLVSEIEPE